MNDTVETRVALMERDIQLTTTMVARLETTVEKIGEVASNVAKILAVHDKRLEQSEENNNELYKLAEARRTEMHEQIKEVNTNLHKLKEELSDDLVNVEQRILKAITDHQKDIAVHKEQEIKDREEKDDGVEKRIRALENWRWMLIGAGVVLGFILGKIPQVSEIFKATIIQ